MMPKEDMTTQSREHGQHEQEEACAQTFLDWLGPQRGVVNYELRRAEEVPEQRGRWDFIARVKGYTDWLALEVKGLVIPQSLRQLGDWSKFSTWVTKELQLQWTVHGTFALITNIPWTFNQTQSKMLVKTFAETLVEVAQNLEMDGQVNLGPRIASRFGDWPTKPPTIDPPLWYEQGVSKVIYPPEDLFVYKLEDTGCSVELGASVGQAFVVDPALSQAVLGIFNPGDGKGAKPNEQLREARQKGTSETVLLLDSHMRWKPNVIALALNGIDQTLLSNIDSVYLVSVANSRVRRVWPSQHELSMDNLEEQIELFDASVRV